MPVPLTKKLCGGKRIVNCESHVVGTSFVLPNQLFSQVSIVVKGLTMFMFPTLMFRKQSWVVQWECCPESAHHWGVHSQTEPVFCLLTLFHFDYPRPRVLRTHWSINALRNLLLTKHSLYSNPSSPNLLEEYFFHVVSLHNSVFSESQFGTYWQS